jgi:hypothetical protein
MSFRCSIPKATEIVQIQYMLSDAVDATSFEVQKMLKYSDCESSILDLFGNAGIHKTVIML